MSDIQVEIEGLEELQREMERIVRDLGGEPMVKGMRRATLLVQRDAKLNAPVDTGRLRASITPEVRPHGKTVQGVVGSNVHYAPYQELGTKPHWPPPGALQPWARRHGMPEFLVRRAIGLRGTKAIKYLERALTENARAIVRILGDTVGRIVRG